MHSTFYNAHSLLRKSLSLSPDTVPKRVKSSSMKHDFHGSSSPIKSSKRLSHANSSMLKANAQMFSLPFYSLTNICLSFTAVSINRAPRPMVTNHSSSFSKVSKRWSESFQLSDPCAVWRCADVEAMCGTGLNITVRPANTHAEDNEISVSAAMMWYVFPLPITDDIACLLRYFDVFPEQHLPLVLLVYDVSRCLKVISRFVSDLKK